jgi:type II secretory pathway pseudopilin PulG
MGQQQLLLIVLGVIIVGIAVLLGIYVFQASSVENKRDVVINESVNIASLAMQYYKKAKLYGGGQYSFTGWEIPADLQTTNNGSYTAQVYADSVIITGTGNEYVTSGVLVQVKTRVNSQGIFTEIIN